MASGFGYAAVNVLQCCFWFLFSVCKPFQPLSLSLRELLRPRIYQCAPVRTFGLGSDFGSYTAQLLFSFFVSSVHVKKSMHCFAAQPYTHLQLVCRSSKTSQRSLTCFSVHAKAINLAACRPSSPHS